MHSFYIKIKIELSSKEKDGWEILPEKNLKILVVKAPSNFLDCK